MQLLKRKIDSTEEECTGERLQMALASGNRLTIVLSFKDSKAKGKLIREDTIVNFTNAETKEIKKFLEMFNI